MLHHVMSLPHDKCGLRFLIVAYGSQKLNRHMTPASPWFIQQISMQFKMLSNKQPILTTETEFPGRQNR